MVHLSQELLEPDGSQGQISLFSMVQCNLRQSAKLHGQDFRGIQDEDDPFSDNRSTCEWMQRDNGVIILKGYLLKNNAAFHIRARPTWRMAL